MNNKVTYYEITEALSNATGISKQKSDDFTKGLVRYIKKELQNSGKATITNFGSFRVKDVAAREGKNPQTGESILIPAHKKVTFRPYKKLKESVNAPYQNLETELVENDSPDQKKKVQPARLRSNRNNSSGAIILSGIVVLIVAVTAIWYFLDSGSGESDPSETAIETAQTPTRTSNLSTENNAEAEATDNEEDNIKEEVTNVAVTASTDEKADNTSEKSETNYSVRDNEWFWVISKKVYGKSEWWPLIYQRNRSLEEDPDNLVSNMRLRIPVLKGSAENPDKEDYKKLAKAAFQVSEAYTKFNKPEKAEEYARFAKRYERLGR